MEFTVSSPWRRFPAPVQFLLVAAPAIVLAVTYLVYLVYRDGYFWGAAEDSLVEWGTVVCYLAALGIAAALVPRWWRRGLPLTAAAYVLLCLGFFFIAGEEISWGQRILGFEGPEALVAANVQDEANLHNLLDRYGLHGLYIVVGIWAVGLGRFVVRRVGWLRPGYAYAPSREVVWWFLPALVFYVYVDYVTLVGATLGLELGEGPPRFQEPVELVLGAGFLLFMIEVLMRSAPRQQQPRHPSWIAASQTSPR